jgi:serine/threonine protein kinase
VKTLRALNHPNIVRFVGACEEPLCLVTEWVPLGSLHDLLIDSSIKITMKDVAKMALDTAYGMRYLHEKNFIHRDLKSHNLLVDEEWKIKVSDFGIARYLSEEGEALTNCGTSGWIAPEILDSVKEFNIGGYGKKADVFSYGICVWEMLTRSRINPLTGLSEEIFKAKIQSGNFLEFGKDSHPDLIEIVRDCCQFDPNLRPSFEQIVDRLERLNNIVF